MAVEIANISLDGERGVVAFLERWGLPVVKEENRPASMAVAELHDLVRNVRDAVALAGLRDEQRFRVQFAKRAYFAAQPRSDLNAALGEPAVFVECRDPAAMAWLQLAQKERIGAEYDRCSVCGTYFVAGGSEDYPDPRSRRYCSDRCQLAAKAATKISRS